MCLDGDEMTSNPDNGDAGHATAAYIPSCRWITPRRGSDLRPPLLVQESGRAGWFVYLVSGCYTHSLLEGEET